MALLPIPVKKLAAFFFCAALCFSLQSQESTPAPAPAHQTPTAPPVASPPISVEEAIQALGDANAQDQIDDTIFKEVARGFKNGDPAKVQQLAKMVVRFVTSKTDLFKAWWNEHRTEYLEDSQTLKEIVKASKPTVPAKLDEKSRVNNALNPRIQSDHGWE